MILRYLSPEEVGLWFVFIALAGLAQLLELGFQPTIARNVAYVYAGAQKLDAHGCAPDTKGAPLNIELLQQLFVAARKIYLGVALAALIVLAVIGSAYISTLLAPDVQHAHVILAWIAFSLGYVINFYYGYFNGFLQGRGDVTSANKVVVASRVALIILASLLLVGGLGLIGVGIASLMSSVLGRILASRLFWDGGGTETMALRTPKATAHSSLLSTLWPNAKNLGWVYLGSFLITRANVLIASSFLGLADAASYGLTFQILVTFTTMSSVVFNLNMPHISRDQIRGHHEKILGKFGRSLAAGWVVYMLGATMLFLFGSTFLNLIGSRTALLETNLLFVFVVFMFLEMNHSVCAGYLTTFNEIPFVRAALLSGVGIVTMSIFTVSILHLGVWGLVLSQGLIQAIYNNWKWPQEASRRLGCSFANVIESGFKGLVSRHHG